MPELNFGCDTLYATHGVHAYAAKCPPQLVRYALHYYSKPGETLLDPMVGSGTALVEARLMGRNALGYDIDPLARLIAQVKSRELEDTSIQNAYDTALKESKRDIRALHSVITPSAVCDRATPPDFPDRDYWFTPNVSEALAILAHHIGKTPMSKPVQDFLWVAFSSLILAKKSVANARDIIHSRHHYWEHSEPPDVLAKFSDRIQRMRKQMTEFRSRCEKVQATRSQARLGDARSLRLQDESVDLIFTSPPYATALDYPRAHFLAVAWMQETLGVSLQEYRKNAPTYIGSERGRLPNEFILDEQLTEFELTTSVVTKLAALSSRYAALTQRYFVDMRQALSQMARVLKESRHAVIVVCPSHIRRVEVPTHQVFVEMGKTLGLRLKKQYTRTINERRRILPYMQEEFGERMSTEYVLVFQKK